MVDRDFRVRVIAELPGYGAAMRTGVAANTAFGESAVAAGRGVTALGLEADASRGGLVALASGARGGGVALGELDAASVAAGRGLRSSAVEANAAGLSMRRAGLEAEGGLARMSSGGARALESMKGLGALLAGGAIFFGVEKIVEKGNEYNDSMQKFLEVTRASGAQMASAGREAQALGADMKLPSANASEAADAMVDLAKAGLSAQDAIAAARGTIQLAAAARTDVATAAQIEGDIMDQFSLKSSEAARVADVLANTSNSASGQLMDIYYAMKYVGPIAHSMGVSIQDAATAVGLLGKSGIIGETAGTALRSALVNMSKPTTAVTKGLKELGIQAYDSQGNFKGLQYVITQLGDAQKHMSTQSFIAAAAMAFGKPALAGMVALAHQGGDAWDTYSLQVTRAGGAAALAAAESKGLGGAMRTLGKEISAAFLQVYLGISPVLEKVTRGFSQSVSDAIPYVQRGIKVAGDLWDIYAPTVEAKLSSASGRIEKVATAWVTPIATALAGLAVGALPLLDTGFHALEATFGNVEKAAAPVDSGLHDLFGSVTSGAGALGVLNGRLQVGVGMLGQATSVLGPLGSVVGGLMHAFAGLPGPIQLSVFAMLAMRPFRPQMAAMQASVVGFGRAGVTAFRGIGDASLYQRVLAAGAGQELGRFGGYVAALEARSPGIASMGTAFRGVTSQIDPAASGVARFGGTLRGLGAGAAVGAINGLKSAAGGLMGALGGPWGLAIGGAMMALDYFAQKQARAKALMDQYTSAVQQDSGALGGNTAALVAQQLKTSGALDAAKEFGLSLGLVEQAAMGNKDALGQVNATIDAQVAAKAANHDASSGALADALSSTQAGDKLKASLGDQNSVLGKSVQSYKDQQAAIAGATAESAKALTPTGRLEGAIKTLGDVTADADTKARALHTALSLLSGGELDVQAAVANMNGSITQLNSSWDQGITKTNGFGKGLLQLDGSLNTTSVNGQELFNKLQDLNTQTASAAQATYDFAQSQGKSLPAALKAAEAAMQSSWQAAVTAGEKFGLTAAQAKELAAQMGFIPSSLAITMSTPGMDPTEKGLLYVQGLADHLPKGATIRVSALTEQAQKDIEAAGFKVKQLPGGRQIEITAPTAKAQANLNAVINKLYAIQSKTVDVTVSYHAKGSKQTLTTNASGGLYPRPGIKAFASGGEDHSAQIAPGGSWRLWAEPETGGESYIPLAMAKRQRSKAILEKTAKIMGGRVAWFGDGGVSSYASGGFSYTPNIPVLGGTDDVMARYSAAVASLVAALATQAGAATSLTAAQKSQSAVRLKETQAVTAAEKHLNEVRGSKHTHLQLVAAEAAVTKARQAAAAADTAAAAKTTAASKAKVAADAAAAAADKSLGVAKGAAAPVGLNLTAYEKQLSDSLAATEAWRANLASVGARGGAAVESILEGMGADGADLTAALAKASSKDFDTIVANLQRVGSQAKATLADFDSQVSASAKTNAQFASDLTSLASRGYGGLAQQLAGQGDQAAMDLAHEAATASSSQLGQISADLASQQAALSGTDLQNALLVITSLRSRPGEGIADVIGAGISASDLLTLAPKIMPQLQALPDAYKQVFLKQLAGQSGGVTAMAVGGILPDGPGTVFAGERGTGGEAWIPLGMGNRARSTAILGDVAGRFGYQLLPAGRFAVASGGGSSGPQHITHHKTVHLHGAKQDTATQAADLLRHMVALG